MGGEHRFGKSHGIVQPRARSGKALQGGVVGAIGPVHQTRPRTWPTRPAQGTHEIETERALAHQARSLHARAAFVRAGIRTARGFHGTPVFRPFKRVSALRLLETWSQNSLGIILGVNPRLLMPRILPQAENCGEHREDEATCKHPILRFTKNRCSTDWDQHEEGPADKAQSEHSQERLPLVSKNAIPRPTRNPSTKQHGEGKSENGIPNEIRTGQPNHLLIPNLEHDQVQVAETRCHQHQ